MAMIELIGLTKEFRGIRAVDGIDLSVGKGLIFGFLGPNGAGKTTTIKMMAGLLRPTRGRIILGGIDLASEPEVAKRILGFIPDRPFLYEKLTAREFLEFFADIHGMGRCAERQSRIEELLEIFDLTGWSDELIEGFSHGMKQRLVMASALLPDPRILVVDEPMVGLDPRASNTVKGIFKRIAEKGDTVFMSTHSLAVAEEICHETAIIHMGRIIAKGTPGKLRNLAGRGESLEKAFLELTKGEDF